MNREEYMAGLRKYLKRLPKKDYENAIQYFNEYFEDAGRENEEKVIKELGTPKQAASDILNNLLEEQVITKENSQINEKNTIHNKGLFNAIWITCLVLFAAPIGLPILICLFVLIFVAVVLILVFAFVVCIIGLVFANVGGRLLICGISMLSSSVAGGIVLIGCSLFSTGIIILIGFLMVYLCRLVGFGITRLTQRIVKRQR